MPINLNDMKLKCVFITFSLMLIINKGISQHLTYDDLLILQSSNTERCEDILSTKGFILSENKYNEETKETSLNWKYKNSENELFTKTCSNLFQGKCSDIFYLTNNEQSFNIIKNKMKAGFKLFLYSNTNSKGVLSHHYLIEAFKSPQKTYSREVVLFTFPTSLTKKNFFAISIKEIDIPLVENK